MWSTNQRQHKQPSCEESFPVADINNTSRTKGCNSHIYSCIHQSNISFWQHIIHSKDSVVIHETWIMLLIIKTYCSSTICVNPSDLFNISCNSEITFKAYPFLRTWNTRTPHNGKTVPHSISHHFTFLSVVVEIHLQIFLFFFVLFPTHWENNIFPGMNEKKDTSRIKTGTGL